MRNIIQKIYLKKTTNRENKDLVEVKEKKVVQKILGYV